MINVVYSTEHWIMPKIIMALMLIFALAIIITEGMERTKKGEAFFKIPKSFFIPNADFVKLFGTLILFAGYIFTLDKLGFTVTSIIFVFLFNILYAGTSKKSILVSIIIAVVGSLLISIAFGVVFQITLPSGALTLVFPDLGFTIY